MKRLICLFMLIFHISLTASTITAYLELVLSSSGKLIDQPTDVTISLLGPSNDVRWTETHQAVNFFKGVAAFQIGHVNEIKTHWFYDKGVQLKLTIGEDSINLPMYATPFSLFSHAADMVNAIQMDGVFHTDLINKRIGIRLDVPTPSVHFEIKGAMRVGDHATIDEIGTIRWRGNRLQGRHNHTWKNLDVSPDDGFESKWLNNNSAESPAFYVLGSSVLVATSTIRATLTAGGNLDAENSFISTSPLTTPGRLNLPNDYGVSINSSLYAKALTLDAANVYNVTTGLKFSGVMTGKANGVTDITSKNIKLNAIQNHELNSSVIDQTHIKSAAVINAKVKPASITRDRFNSAFKLTNDYFLAQVVTNNKIKRDSVHEDDLSTSFSLTPFHFQPNAVVNRNIGAGEIDAIKIKDNELVLADFKSDFIDSYAILNDKLIASINIKDGSIKAEDFTAGSLSYSHFNAVIPINKGGTGSTSFGNTGEMLVVSNNVVKSEPGVVLTSNGLGIRTTSPTQRLDITQVNGFVPLRVKSNQASSALVYLRNDVGQWSMGLTPTNNFIIMDHLNNRRVFSMRLTDGHIGIKTEPGNELMVVNGGVLLGDKHVANGASLKEGSMYFSMADKKFKLRTAAGLTYLMSEPVIPFTDRLSYFHLENINNQGANSRVLLANDIDLRGDKHFVQGAFDSVIDGHRLSIKHLISSHVLGEDSRFSFIENSHLNGKNNHARFLKDTTLKGDNHQLNFVDASAIQGDSHHLDQLSNSQVFGRHHAVFSGANLMIQGEHNRALFTKSALLYGHDQMMNMANDAVTYGQGHYLNHVSSLSVDGENNVVEHSKASAINGEGNYISGAQSSTIVGSKNYLLNPTGVYLGDNNYHFGGGNVQLIGNNTMLFGSHHGRVHADALLSFGKNDVSLSKDHAIIFNVPGGVDIIEGDITLAHK